MKSRGYIGPLIATIIPYLCFELLRYQTSLDPHLKMPTGHFYIVSSVAVLAAIMAIAVGVSGIKLRNIKVSFLSLSFMSLATIFALHGLATPGFIMHAYSYHLPSFAAQLSILLATCWLYLSSLASDHPIVVWLSRFQRWLVPVWTCLLITFCTTALLFPDIAEFFQIDKNPLKWPVAGFVIVLNAIAAFRYYQAYQYSRFPLQIAIVYSAGWLLVSQIIMSSGQLWHVSWWLYHFLLLGSMIIMLAGLVRQYSNKHSLAGAIKSLYASDPLERIVSLISPSVKALILATETRDTYTAGHNVRVALYALRLGEELKLRPEQLRAIAQGTIVHDVGKINIQDSILNKPGKLSDEERTIIETHPVKGYEMCRHLGFMKEELDIILHHHEKMDGTGYPNQLSGDHIPFMARVVAVADVYDALTSNRSYRKAWTHEAAMNLMIEQKGIHFDTRCIEAWQRLCESDPDVYKYPMQMVTDHQADFTSTFSNPYSS